jgi:hypothetical protein
LAKGCLAAFQTRGDMSMANAALAAEDESPLPRRTIILVEDS